MILQAAAGNTILCLINAVGCGFGWDSIQFLKKEEKERKEK